MAWRLPLDRPDGRHRLGGSRSNRRRATLAWIPMTLTWWATTPCSSPGDSHAFL
jgi:hypothetical protein